MRNLKRALAALFVLLLAAVVLFFVLENQQNVALVLFGWSAPAVPVAVLVLAALVLGLAVGPLLGTYAFMPSKRNLRRSARQEALTGSYGQFLHPVGIYALGSRAKEWGNACSFLTRKGPAPCISPRSPTTAASVTSPAPAISCTWIARPAC